MKTLQNLYDVLAGTFDSSRQTATSTGNIIQQLRYVANNLLWATSNGNVYYNGGGKVGIGTTTPSYSLEVVGNVKISGSGNKLVFPDGTEQTTASLGSAATTTINGVLGPTFTFATSSDANLHLRVSTSTGTVTFTPVWNGTLDNARIASSSAWLVKSSNLSDLTSTSTARDNLGLADTATLASSTWAKTANNLSDLNSTSTARNNLGIGTGDSPTFASITLSNFTAGSVPFFGTSGVLLQNNTNLFWDNTNTRLGVGTSTP